MIRKQKIEDSPEFRYFEEHFDEMMEEMEKDSESQSFEIPEEWDRSFRKTIEETVEREEKKKSRKEKLLKWGSRAVAAAAGVALVMFIGMNFSAVQVQGEGLLDVFRNTFDLNGKKYTTVDVGEEMDMDMEEEQVDVYFEGTSLDDVYRQIREEFKMPMFYVTYVPEGYEVEEAKYNRMYDILNIKIINEEDTIYISQQRQIDETATGVVNEENICMEVFNSNINQIIEIYESVQDNNLIFNVNVNQELLTVRCAVSAEEIKKIAESIEFY